VAATGLCLAGTASTADQPTRTDPVAVSATTALKADWNYADHSTST
jgi:hypothetical protein